MEKSNLITQKYIRLSKKATFTNQFIKECLIADARKDPFQNNLTTGNDIDGKTITKKGLIAKFPHYEFEIEHFLKEAIQGNKPVPVTLNYNNGDEGRLSAFVGKGEKLIISYMITKNEVKEYTYLLINDDTFIGYDID